MPCRALVTAAVAIALSILASGCGGSSADRADQAGGDSQARRGVPPAAAGGDQGNRGVPPGYAQSLAVHASPQAVATAFWQHVGRGEFEAACQLFPPGSIPMATCVHGVQKEWSAKKRAKMTAPEVDAEKIQLDGDTATIPSEAIHNHGKPTYDGYDETQPRYDTTKCLRVGGQWWVDPAS